MKKSIAFSTCCLLTLSSLLPLASCQNKESELTVLDGVFNRTCTFSMDLEYKSDSNLDPFVLALFSLTPDEDAKKQLMNATQGKDYYKSRNLFFLTDGTYIIAQKDSDAMCKFDQLLSPGASEEELEKEKYTVGGYRILENEDKTYKLTISGGTLQSFIYYPSEGVFKGAGSFKEEHYQAVKTMEVPDTSVDAKSKYQKVKSNGILESQYLAFGDCSVSSKTYREKNSETYFQYKVWYPTEMIKSDKKYPLVVMTNGTGVICQAYEHVFEHLASWGFIVIGNDEGMSWNGQASDNSLSLMLQLNSQSDSDFFGKIDTDKIGISGHSQGGVGVINALTVQSHASLYKAAVILSCGNKSVSQAMQWNYDDTKIKTPTLMLASDGQTDAKLVPLTGLEELFNDIPSTVDKVMARRKGCDHGEMLYYADGYVTAWFKYYLQGDEEAYKAFYGDKAELLSNSQYQDQLVNKA